MNKVGNFRILGRLGGGGMADVYLARDEREPASKTSKLYALKTPRPDMADDPEFVSMFLDEARLAARLEHPNIVRTVEVGEADGRLFIAMEYLDGQPLHRIIAKVPELTLPMHLRILTEVLRGIHFAHEVDDGAGGALNIIHRDLTPQNVFVTYEGATKILDFGIARAEGRSSKSSVGMMKGKVSYMSPEQAISHQLDRRADLFAIGVMLFEACTQKRMWEETSELDILNTLNARRHPRSPQVINPDVHDDLDAICHRALSVIDHRYQTAKEFLRDIESFIEEHVQLPTEADIAAVLAPVFSAKREKMRATIDEQLAKMTRPVAPARAGVPLPSSKGSNPAIPARPAIAARPGPGLPSKPGIPAVRARPALPSKSGMAAVPGPPAKPVSLRDSVPEIETSDPVFTEQTRVATTNAGNLDHEEPEAPGTAPNPDVVDTKLVSPSAPEQPAAVPELESDKAIKVVNLRDSDEFPDYDPKPVPPLAQEPESLAPKAIDPNDIEALVASEAASRVGAPEMEIVHQAIVAPVIDDAPRVPSRAPMATAPMMPLAVPPPPPPQQLRAHVAPPQAPTASASNARRGPSLRSALALGAGVGLVTSALLIMLERLLN